MTGPIQPQLVVAALVVLSCGPAFAAHAKRPPADHKAVPAVAEAEPAVLKKIMAAHWQLAGALPGLPQLQVVHNEALEFQDFVQYAFDGGALRLCVSPGPRQNDIFALLYNYSPHVQPLLDELAHYVNPSDLREIRNILNDIQGRIDRIDPLDSATRHESSMPDL